MLVEENLVIQKEQEDNYIVHTLRHFLNFDQMLQLMSVFETVKGIYMDYFIIYYYGRLRILCHNLFLSLEMIFSYRVVQHVI